MGSIELADADYRTAIAPAAAPIDAEAVVQELSRPPLPADPEVLEIRGAKAVGTVPCPVCDGTQATPRFAIKGSELRLVVCNACGLGTLYPKPTPAAIASFYPPEYYGSPGAKFAPYIETMVRWAAGRTARRLSQHLPQGARVLDVGCGRGVLLSAWADRGLEAHGFEISPTAAQGADPRARIAIAPSLEQADYPADAFDLVVLCHVLEHLPEPRQTLAEIHRILKPGGRLVVSVPNFSSWQAQWAGPAWFHLDLPRHLSHFPAEGLARLLEKTGFSCERPRYFSLRQDPFGWVQSGLNKYSGSRRNTLYSLLKRNAREPGSRKELLQRTTQQAAYWLGMPAALFLSLISSAFRRGATVTIIAEAPRGDRQ